jgi:chromate reductase, NAD(P)H dehydrogenase (quinone)
VGAVNVRAIRSIVRTLGIAGSLRAASFNRALLRAAVELAPDGVEIRIFEGLGAIPLYDADVEARRAIRRPSPP